MHFVQTGLFFKDYEKSIHKFENSSKAMVTIGRAPVCGGFRREGLRRTHGSARV